MRRTRRRILASIVLLLASIARAEWTLLPLARGGASLGATSFAGRRSGFRGNLRGEFVPVVEAGDHFAVLPVLSASFVGHQSSRRVADERALFQDATEASLGVSTRHRFAEGWAWALRGGERFTWLRETTDERRWRGTYDHHDVWLGADVERAAGGARPGFWRGGWEASASRFPRYLNDGSPLGRRPLDSRSFSLFLRAETFAVRTQWEWETRATGVFYPDQGLMNADGTVGDGHRRDRRIDATVRGRRSFGALSVSADAGLLWQTSNRGEVGNLDGVDQRFFPRYHDFLEPSLGGGLRWDVNERWRVGADVNLRGRFHRDRAAQNDDGTFRTDRFFTYETDVAVTGQYRLTERFTATFTGDLGHGDANTDGPTAGLHHFTARHIEIGLSYEY